MNCKVKGRWKLGVTKILKIPFQSKGNTAIVLCILTW
jgi:hypothetical protein